MQITPHQETERARSPRLQDRSVWRILFVMGHERSFARRWASHRTHDEIHVVHDDSALSDALLEPGSWDCVVVDLSLPDGAGSTMLEAAEARDPHMYQVAIAGDIDATMYDPLFVDGLVAFGRALEPPQLEQRLKASTRFYRARLHRMVQSYGRSHGLTPREVEILDLRAAGVARSDACERLQIRLRTHDNHVAALCAKVGRRPMADVVSEVRRRVRGG